MPSRLYTKVDDLTRKRLEQRAWPVKIPLGEAAERLLAEKLEEDERAGRVELPPKPAVPTAA